MAINWDEIDAIWRCRAAIRGTNATTSNQSCQQPKRAFAHSLQLN
jgi:hypothetical protein